VVDIIGGGWPLTVGTFFFLKFEGVGVPFKDRDPCIDVVKS